MIMGRQNELDFLGSSSPERRYGFCLAGVLVVCSRGTLDGPCAAFGSDLHAEGFGDISGIASITACLALSQTIYLVEHATGA